MKPSNRFQSWLILSVCLFVVVSCGEARLIDVDPDAPENATGPNDDGNDDDNPTLEDHMKWVEEQETIVTPWTHRFDGDELDDMVIDGDLMIFPRETHPDLKNVRVGDNLWSPQADMWEQMFAKRVLDTAHDDENFVFVTRDAALNDIFYKLTLDTTKPETLVNAVEGGGEPGTREQPLEGTDQTQWSEDFEIKLDICVGAGGSGWHFCGVRSDPGAADYPPLSGVETGVGISAKPHIEIDETVRYKITISPPGWVGRTLNWLKDQFGSECACMVRNWGSSESDDDDDDDDDDFGPDIVQMFAGDYTIDENGDLHPDWGWVGNYDNACFGDFDDPWANHSRGRQLDEDDFKEWELSHIFMDEEWDSDDKRTYYQAMLGTSTPTDQQEAEWMQRRRLELTSFMTNHLDTVRDGTCKSTTTEIDYFFDKYFKVAMNDFKARMYVDQTLAGKPFGSAKDNAKETEVLFVPIPVFTGITVRPAASFKVGFEITTDAEFGFPGSNNGPWFEARSTGGFNYTPESGYDPYEPGSDDANSIDGGLGTFGVGGSARAKVWAKPGAKVKVKILGVLGPYVTGGVKGEAKVEVGGDSVNGASCGWEVSIGGFLDIGFEAGLKLFGVDDLGSFDVNTSLIDTCKWKKASDDGQPLNAFQDVAANACWYEGGDCDPGAEYVEPTAVKVSLVDSKPTYDTPLGVEYNPLDAVYVIREDGTTLRPTSVAVDSANEDVSTITHPDLTRCSWANWNAVSVFFQNDVVVEFDEPLQEGDRLYVTRLAAPGTFDSVEQKPCASSGHVSVAVGNSGTDTWSTVQGSTKTNVEGLLLQDSDFLE